MSPELYAKVCEQMPRVISDLYNWNNPDKPKEYSLIVTHWSKRTNKVTEKAYYAIDLDDFMSDLQRAKKLADATITVTDTVVTVRRESPTADKVIVAEYKPLAN